MAGASHLTPYDALRPQLNPPTTHNWKPSPSIFLMQGGRLTVLENTVGLFLIAIALHDVFHTLFNPSSRGALAESISFRTWRVWRSLFPAQHKRLGLAGPLAFLLTVLAWSMLIVFGFALIYHPFLSRAFIMPPGLNIREHTSLFDAVNVSLGSLISLGVDFNTSSRWVRLAIGLEAVAGFVLLTASLSWVLSIYPVLEYRRSAAHRLSLLHRAQRIERVGLGSMPEQETEQLVISLASDLTKIRGDLAQFPITYYFHEHEPQSAWPGALPLAWEVAGRASGRESSEPVRIAGILLQGAIHDYLSLVGAWFLHMPGESDEEKLLAAYAADHFRKQLREV